jgi:hypothetical protein
MSDFLKSLIRAWKAGWAEYHRARWQYKRRKQLQREEGF